MVCGVWFGVCGRSVHEKFRPLLKFLATAQYDNCVTTACGRCVLEAINVDRKNYGGLSVYNSETNV